MILFQHFFYGGMGVGLVRRTSSVVHAAPRNPKLPWLGVLCNSNLTWPPTAGEERKHPKVMIFEFISEAFITCLWAGHRKPPHFAQSPHAFPLGKTGTSLMLSFIPPSVSGHAQGALTDFHRTKNSSEEPHARGGTCLVK